jgi:hypothetical protein
MVHRARLEQERFAKHDHFVAGGEILFHERQIPPPAMQAGRAVIEDEFVDGPGMLLIPFYAVGHDFAPGRRRLVKLQAGDGQECAAILVAARPMQQEIFDGENLEPGQLRGALWADARQSGHTSGEG